jgi:hypothetical protein
MRTLDTASAMSAGPYAPALDCSFPGQIDLLKEALQASAVWTYALGTG